MAEGADDRIARSEGGSEAGKGPAWLAPLLGVPFPAEGQVIELGSRRFVVRQGILREDGVLSEQQAQTAGVFGFKWHQTQTFETPAMRSKAATWMREKYGDVATAEWWKEYGEHPLLLDAGCGAALSALELFGDRLREVRYLGVDVSDAVDVAATRFTARGYEAGFLQADLVALPLQESSVDVIFSEGVLHHTDSTKEAIARMASLLRPGGRILFYVYRKKAPVREFTDDYIRDHLQSLSREEAWTALMPLTRLGKLLGDLNISIDIEEEVDLLGIPAGPVNLHRLFYWYFFKAFHHPDFSLDELNHINYDWYAPRNAHRHTPEEVRSWCAAVGLDIEREHLGESGITIIGRKR